MTGDAGLTSDTALSGEAALARAFEAQRPRLLRLAYATTGSLAEAEDCVQEAWLRLDRAADREAIRDLGAWLTTTVSRIALDSLGSARACRERQTGPWLPEPVVENLSAGIAAGGDAGADPADRVTLDESVSMALLVVLETLSPAERTAFVLHDVFGLPFDEISGVVGRSSAAVRQLASRARRHVRDGRPRVQPNGGGKVQAAPRLAHGAAAIGRLLAGFARRPPRRVRTALVKPGQADRGGGPARLVPRRGQISGERDLDLRDRQAEVLAVVGDEPVRPHADRRGQVRSVRQAELVLRGEHRRRRGDGAVNGAQVQPSEKAAERRDSGRIAEPQGLAEYLGQEKNGADADSPVALVGEFGREQRRHAPAQRVTLDAREDEHIRVEGIHRATRRPGPPGSGQPVPRRIPRRSRRSTAVFPRLPR
jgi:RNA polymerase sigma-70 factor, ECF subfamily